jgi:signal transduction histidine kinase
MNRGVSQGRVWSRFVTAILFGLCISAGTLPGAVSPVTVNTVRAIRGLPDSLLKTRPSVSLSGVVTFHDSLSGLTYMEDEQGGIELRGVPETDGIVPGRRIEITGSVDDSRPIPGVSVNKEALKILETGEMRPALPLSAEQIRTGEMDGRRVMLDASIFRMELSIERGDRPWLRLNVATPSGHLTWLVPWAMDKPLPLGLLHAKVRGTGICEAIFNNRGQRIGILLLIGSIEDVSVVRPPLRDPFDKPTRSLAELMRPGLDDPFDRVRVEGVVLCQQQTAVNLVHLRTAQGAMQIEMVAGEFAVGDRLAVVGYPVLSNKHVVLREGLARKLGHEAPPLPLEMSVAALMQAGGDSDLVKIQGTVLRNGLEAANGSLFIESSERVVEVTLSGSFTSAQRADMAHHLASGTVLELTGVAELQGPMLTTGTVNLTDMRLTVRTPGDILILRAPPWWTPGRLLALAGGLAAVLALSSAWVFLLRRRVTAQTEIIREKVGRETRWVERSRIARDIHDDVGSALTQITLLGDLGSRGGREPREMEEQFDRISSQAREAVRALDAIVWTVNPKNDSLSVTVSYLCQTVQDLTRDAGIRCRLEIPDEIPEMVLGAMVRHNLLLAAKEAVHNVLKHAHSSVLRLRMECGNEALGLEVSDDGCGFETSKASNSRTGLDSMRQRMADVGGTLEISSEPGRGTTVAFILPWRLLG